MRLFELDSSGDGRAVLSVIQGLANRPGKEMPAELPFQAFKNLIRGDEIGVGTPNALIAFKNKEDPSGDVFDIKDDGQGNFTVILNTKKKKDQPQGSTVSKPTGPSVDAMASSNSKQLQPNI